MEDEDYFEGFGEAFALAARNLAPLPPERRKDGHERLLHIRRASNAWGWGVRDDIDAVLIEYLPEAE